MSKPRKTASYTSTMAKRLETEDARDLATEVAFSKAQIDASAEAYGYIEAPRTKTIWDLAEKAQREVDAWPEEKRNAADQALVTPKHLRGTVNTQTADAREDDPAPKAAEHAIDCPYCDANEIAAADGVPERYLLRSDGQHEATDDDGLCLEPCGRREHMMNEQHAPDATATTVISEDGYMAAERHCYERIGKLLRRQRNAAPDDRMDTIAALQGAMRLCWPHEDDADATEHATDEPSDARIRAEAEAVGRAAERADVVRWLRNVCAANGASRACLEFEEIAEALEDEEHIGAVRVARPNRLAWSGTEWVDERCGCAYHPDDNNGTHGGGPHVHACDEHRNVEHPEPVLTAEDVEILTSLLESDAAKGIHAFLAYPGVVRDLVARIRAIPAKVSTDG